MYEFFDCLIFVVLFCVCDFRGINDKSFDGCGNYIMGIKEQIVFFEIDFDKVSNIIGMDIIFVIIVDIDVEVLVLLKGLGFLFKNQNN